LNNSDNFLKYLVSENRTGLPYQRSAIGIPMGGEYLIAFSILDARSRITIVATLGEVRRLFHCIEATDNFLIETAKASDGLNYLKHVIVFLSSIIVVCHAPIIIYYRQKSRAFLRKKEKKAE
tara:strand:+ start:199 stop:564 length:366 start_codon:yes stop_codon:yes gene_type:complete